MQILTCERVGKVYGAGENQVAALKEIDLVVERGEFTAITGDGVIIGLS
ncbi:MAG: hypothetical protein NC302_11460 [Bacteroidales bacterium]|nr:hypothetical protein [Bacteroidales bacterium]